MTSLPPASVGRDTEQRNLRYYLYENNVRRLGYVDDFQAFRCPKDTYFWKNPEWRQSYSYWFEHGVSKQTIQNINGMGMWGYTISTREVEKVPLVHDGEPWTGRDYGKLRHYKSMRENTLYDGLNVHSRDTHFPDDGNQGSPFGYNGWVGPRSWGLQYNAATNTLY